MGAGVDTCMYILELWSARYLLCVCVLSTSFYIILYNPCNKPSSCIRTPLFRRGIDQDALSHMT